jgi:hypothetical protein
MSSGTDFAYLAEGKLYVSREGRAPELVSSPFVQGILDRVSRDRQRNEWKTKGAGWQFGAGGLRSAMPGAPAAELRRVQYTGISRGQEPGELLYALDTDHVGGLFSFKLDEQYERRLIHRNQFRCRDLARNPGDGTLALSLLQSDGSANIAVMAPECKGLREVTEGDSLDEAPSWSPDGRTLVFQSAGIGRNAMGLAHGIGPYAIQRLDLERGSLETLIEDDQHDYLTPRLGPDGALYFIRRPYQGQPSVSLLAAAGDIVLFPFRFARAVVHFLNFFSMFFARKPLLTAGGPPKEGPDARYIMLWGKLIDAEKALNQSRKLGGNSLVPASWELVRRDIAGGEQVLSKSVLSFDLRGDSVLFCDGSSIKLREPSGTLTQLATGRLIERLVAL